MTKNADAGGEEFIRNLGRGDFFGEKALTASSRSPSEAGERIGDIRTANVIADENIHSKVCCLVIDRDAFHQLISTRVSPFEHHDPDRDSRFVFYLNSIPF